MAKNPFITMQPMGKNQKPSGGNKSPAQKPGPTVPTFQQYLKQQQAANPGNPYTAAASNGGGGGNKGGGNGGGNNKGNGNGNGGGGNKGNGNGNGNGNNNQNNGGGGNGNGGKGGGGKTWTPEAEYSAYGSDYFDQGNKYGNNMEIAGSGKAPEKPDAPKWYEDGMARKDMSNQQQNQFDRYREDRQEYERQNKQYQGTDNYLSNQDPYAYFNKVMGQAGYTPGGGTGFENWLKDEFTQIQDGFNNATYANNQLNFNDYLRTFGGPNQLARFLMTRYNSRTPEQQGMTGGNAYGGPSRWSVF